MSEQVNFSINFSSDPKVLKETEDRIKGVSQATAGAEKSIQHYFDVTKENITIQKQVIADLERQLKEFDSAIQNAAPGKLKGDLMQERASIASELNAEKNALVQLEAEVKKTEVSHDTLRTALRKLQEEMARMEMSGKRNTDEYRAIQLEAGRVADAIGDVKKQSRILANDERMFQGVVEGIGGIAGAFSAAQGAVGLFAGENENLQKIMTRVQSLMAITIGLQQIAQVVNKDSAFRVVVLTRAKEMWAATNIKVATSLGITTGAASALMATLTLGLSVAITAVIAGLSVFISKQGEAKKEMADFNKAVAESAAKPVASIIKLSTEWKKLGDNINAKSQFIKEHRKEFDQLGVSIKKVSDAENLLIQNTEAFVNAQIARAKAEATRKIAVEKTEILIKKELERDNTPKTITYTNTNVSGAGPMGGVPAPSVTRTYANPKFEQIEKEITKLTSDLTTLYNRASNFDKLADGILAGLNTGTTKGIIDDLEQQIKDLEEKKKGETSKAEISKYNSEIKKLKDKLKQYDLPSDQSSTKAISDFKGIVKTKLEEIQFINDRIKFLQDEQSKISPKDKNSKEKGTVINDLLTEELKRSKQITSDILNQYKVFLGQRIDFSTDYYNSISAIDAQIESTTDEAKKKELLQMKDTYKALYDMGINGFDALKQLNDGSIADFGTFEEKKLQIVQKYEKEIAAARYVGNEARAKNLETGRDQEITQLLEDTVKSADAIAKLFTGIDQLGDKAKSTMMKNLKFLIDWVDQNKNNPNAEWTGSFIIDPVVLEQLKASPEVIDAIKKSYIDFVKESDKPAFVKLMSAIKELKRANKDNDLSGAEAASSNIADNIAGATMELIAATDLFAQVMNAFGVDGKVTQFVSQATSAIATVSESGADSIQGASSLIGLAISFISLTLEQLKTDMSDVEAATDALSNGASRLRSIWESTSFKPQKILLPEIKPDLGIVYIEVEFKTKDEAFEAYKQNLQSQIDSLNFQLQEYQDSFLFESNIDPKVVAEFLEKIAELTGELANADEAFANTFGEWSTVVEQLSDSIFDAFENGTDAATSFADKLKDIFKSMIKDAFMSQVVAAYLQPIKDYIDWEIADKGADILLDKDWINYFSSLFAGVSDKIVQDAQVLEDLLGENGIAANGLQTAIKTITSEEAGIIAGNLNAYRITGYEIKELITEALLYLSKIETNTSYIKKIYDKINSSSNFNYRSTGQI